MNEDVIATAYKAVCLELDRLAKVKAALEEAGAKGQKLPHGEKDAIASLRPATTGGKAPAGTLQKAIIDALRLKGSLNNSEVRSAILANGYAYSLNPMHVGKTLAKLLSAGKIKRTGKNSGARYTLKK